MVRYLLQSVEELRDPIVSWAYADKLVRIRSAMNGSNVEIISKTIYSQTDQIDTDSLEIITTGLDAIKADTNTKGKFYQTNKQYIS